jgi:hypothetical protein
LWVRAPPGARCVEEPNFSEIYERILVPSLFLPRTVDLLERVRLAQTRTAFWMCLQNRNRRTARARATWSRFADSRWGSRSRDDRGSAFHRARIFMAFRSFLLLNLWGRSRTSTKNARKSGLISSLGCESTPPRRLADSRMATVFGIQCEPTWSSLSLSVRPNFGQASESTTYETASAICGP